MPANLRTCAECSTSYAIDLSACPHCGSSSFVDEGGVVSKRLPLFVTTSCLGCGRGPWTVRLTSMNPGLVILPTLACVSCGSQVPVTWPPEEEPMSPKITVHGGATNAREADVSPAADASQPPRVGAEADPGRTNLLEADEVVGEALPEGAAEAYAEDAKPVAEGDLYAGMTLAELRAEADGRDVPSYGTKAQIAERLREADAAAQVPGSDAGTE